MGVFQQAGISQNVWDLVLNAGIVAKIVLGILLLFSLISWAIILDKLRVFRRLRKDSEQFLKQFQKHRSPKEIAFWSKDWNPKPNPAAL